MKKTAIEPCLKIEFTGKAAKSEDVEELKDIIIIQSTEIWRLRQRILELETMTNCNS